MQIIDDLKSRLCRDQLVEMDEVEGQVFAITSFDYPNGDSVNLYFQDLGDDELAVSDEGTTLRFLRHQNIELTTDRQNIIKAMCGPYGVDFQLPRLVKPFNAASAGPACIAFCEAVTRVSSIYYHASGALRSPLPVEVDQLLRKQVQPKRAVERLWTARQYDPKGSFPVDFHVNSFGPPRNIFAVTSRSKGILVTAVVHFLRSHGLDFPTMTIVDPEAKLGPRDINRLQLASTELRFGIEKHHRDVVRFALAEDGAAGNPVA